MIEYEKPEKCHYQSQEKMQNDEMKKKKVCCHVVSTG